MNKTVHYAKALSQIHHHSFSQIAESAAHTILNLTKNVKPQKIIDLGCGSGVTAKILSDQGHIVTGVDISQAMIDLATKSAPKATFEVASLFDYSIRSCDLVCAIGEPFNYLFDEKSDETNLAELFQRIYQSLTEKGRLIFDILTTSALGNESLIEKIVESQNWTLFIHLSKDRRQEILTRKITIFYKDGEKYTKSVEIHRQKLYDQNRVLQMLESTGFKVTIGGNYGELTLREGQMVFVCRK